MMPLTMAAANEINYIKKVGGNSEVKRHLETLGFVAGGEVRVISQLNGNLIVSIKDCKSETASWRGCLKTPYHGYGNYKRQPDLCTQGGSAW